MPVANSGKPIFVPAIRAGASVIMGKGVPCIPVGTVVFSHCAPGALSNKGSPTIPIANLVSIHRQANAFPGVIYAHNSIPDLPLGGYILFSNIDSIEVVFVHLVVDFILDDQRVQTLHASSKRVYPSV